MQRWTNYHSHTKYCDGTDEPKVYAEAALAQGMAAYGFSGHSPVPFENNWSMKAHDIPAYIEDVNKLKAEYEGRLDIYLSMEVDYLPGITGVKDYFIAKLGLDYTVGSVHFVNAFEDGKPWEIDYTTTSFENGLNEIFGGDIKKAVTRYNELTRQMLAEECPNIVGHVDKIKMHNKVKPFFSESDAWYRDEVMHTLTDLAKTGAIMEANTRGIYKKYSDETYPSAWIFKEAKKLGIPVMINSDSHVPREITGEFEKAATMLLDSGYKEVRVLLGGKWHDKALTTQGIII